MKKIISVLSVLLYMAPAAAYDMSYNPFMGYAKNQVAVNFATGVNSGFLIPSPTKFVPFTILNVQYSQPTTFFKIPARQSINVAQTFGFGEKYGWQWRDFTIPMIYLSEDIALFCGARTYFGMGAGVGLQAQQNDRIGSKLLFQFKLTAGYRINERVNLELFAQHFSNANTAEANHSYGFYGAGFVYNF